MELVKIERQLAEDGSPRMIHAQETNMNRKTFGLAFVSALFVLVPAFDANAWMDQWAPAFKAAPAKVQALSRTSVSNYVCTDRQRFVCCRAYITCHRPYRFIHFHF